jgi:iron complex transport system permease protein
MISVCCCPPRSSPAAACWSIADTLARSMLARLQLPVGVLTALIGVPVFLFLLSRAAPGRH